MTLTHQQVALASKETMAVALNSAPSALAPAASPPAAVVVASHLATTAVVEASIVSESFEDPFKLVLDTALEEEEIEVHIDEAVASALEGISLALSMDNPLEFLAMRLVSHEPETQGEPPQFSTAGSSFSQGEFHSSHLSPAASLLGNVSSYMEMLFGSKKTTHSDPTKLQDSLHRLEDQLSEVK